MFGKCLIDSNLKNIPIKVLIFMLSPIYSTGSVVIVKLTKPAQNGESGGGHELHLQRSQ